MTLSTTRLCQSSGHAIEVQGPDSSPHSTTSSQSLMATSCMLPAEPRSRQAISTTTQSRVQARSPISTVSCFTVSDWHYQFGYDENSHSGDPQFVDLDGADNRLGFDRGNGLQASYYNNELTSAVRLCCSVSKAALISVRLACRGAQLQASTPTISPPVGMAYSHPRLRDYTFYALNNDGVRFTFDNVLRIDQWLPITTNSVPR